MSFVALIVSVALAIFGRQPYQKYIAYVIGSSVCFVLSIVYAYIIEKSHTINDFLDMTAVFFAGLIIFISFVLAKVFAGLFR